jgi:hypothetical protein
VILLCASHAPIQSKEGDRRQLKPEDKDSNDELLLRDSPPVKPKVGTAISPNSFLSMPSIKAFPRYNTVSYLGFLMFA